MSEALDFAIEDLIDHGNTDYLEEITGYEYDNDISNAINIKNLSAALKKYYLRKAGEVSNGKSK